MKIILASCVAPFVEGGSTFIVDWLGEMIQAFGHEVDVLKLPFSSKGPEMLEQMLALRLIDVSQHGDRLIAIRTPSYLLRHPNKVLWFIHHHRGAYDLWGTKYQDLPNTPEGIRYRDSIINADNRAFSEARAIFCNSQVVADRLKKFNNVNSEVLYPPIIRPERFHSTQFGDYLVYVSRLTHHKRQWLAIEAMQYTKTPVKLIVAGVPDPGSEAYVDQLWSLVEKWDLRSRVSIISRWISEDEKVALLADSLAALYMPFDEDSYGYPSLEAQHAGKPVLTTSDSGATRELIIDRENGILAAPSPEAIAAAMDELYANRQLAKRLGDAGPERIQHLNITWNRVIERLLS